MAVPIIGRRRDRREATRRLEVEAEVQKAISPAVAMAMHATSGRSPSGAYGMQVNPSSPFNQVGPGAGFQPLPRPEGLFDSGFGPGYPLFPDAIDPLTPDGRTLPRRAQYLIAANINLIDRRLPWSVLKGLAEDVDIIQRCIQLVQDAIVGLDWSWGFSPQILQQIMLEQNITNSSKANAFAREKYGNELQRVSAFFEYPDKRMGFTFSQWLTDIIYSHLVYDGIVISPQYNLGGELISLSTIDTPTIKILLDNQGFIPAPPAPAYQQILYGFPRGEYQAENVSTDDGTVPNGFQSDQLAYYIRRVHADSVYGYSQVEECINIATIYMERQGWLHAEYTHGVTPKMIIEVDGAESWTPEQIGFYSQILNDQLSGQTQRRQQALVMRPGMKAEQLKPQDSMYSNAWDEWLVMQIGAKFGIPQSQLGIQMHSSIGGGQTKGQSDQSEMFATDALKNFLIDCINDMARRFMGVGPELTMTCTGGGDGDDDVQRAQSDASDVNSGIRTSNEIRAERGIPLIDVPEADQLRVNAGPAGVVFLEGTLAAQQTAASIAANPPQPIHIHQAAPGAPDDTTAQGSDGASDAGQQSGNGGTGKDQSGSTSDGGSGSTSGATSTDGSGDSTSTSSGAVAAKDDERQPDADATKELIQFAGFVKARSKAGTWRDFKFTSVDATTAAQLNAQGRLESLPKGVALVGPTIRKAASDWSKHPNHELHDIVVDYYAPKLAAALTPSKSQITAAIAAAKKDREATKAAGAAEPSPIQAAAQDAIASHAVLNPDEAQNILRMIYGNAYLAGAHTAVGQIGGGAKLSAGLDEADAEADWSSWVPGWSAAGDLTADGGLADLLDNAGVTINSVAENMISRLGNVIADGISAGDNVDTIASAIADSVGGNAELIANTETARAMTQASQDTYADNGVDRWRWLAEDDACQICLDASDDSPYDVGDDPDPMIPAHPRCRCVSIPIITLPGSDTDIADHSDDDEGDDE